MKRDLSRLEREEFDVVVIGGGINGAAAAHDASLRGLKTVLLEKADFGSKTSSGCFKIAHGGLRYLQHLNFKRMLESVEEQRLLRLNAPHLVRPLPFLIPCYKKLMQRKSVLRLAMHLYEGICFQRNRGVDSAQQLLSHRSLSTDETLHFAPSLRREGLTGGVIYYDAQMSNVDRLTFEVVKSAEASGAVVLNYAEVFSADFDTLASLSGGARQLNTVKVRDVLSDREFAIKGKYFVNATGPWLDILFSRLSAADDVESEEASVCAAQVYSKGIQLVLPEVMSRCALAVESAHDDTSAKVSRGARSYFMQPWRGKTLIGTSDSIFRGDPSSYRIDSREVNEFCAEVYRAYPDTRISAKNVEHAFGGLRPADSSLLNAGEGAAKVSKTDTVVQHQETRKKGAVYFENLCVVKGVKYTTFRALAEKTVDLVSRYFEAVEGRVLPKCQTRENKLIGAPAQKLSQFQQGLVAEGLSGGRSEYLASNYGIAAHRILDLDPNQGELSLGVSRGEVLLAIRDEMACSLSDIVMRRTPVGALGRPSSGVIRAIAEIASDELGWDEQELMRQEAELVAEFDRYHLSKT